MKHRIRKLLMMSNCFMLYHQSLLIRNDSTLVSLKFPKNSEAQLHISTPEKLHFRVACCRDQHSSPLRSLLTLQCVCVTGDSDGQWALGGLEFTSLLTGNRDALNFSTRPLHVSQVAARIVTALRMCVSIRAGGSWVETTKYFIVMKRISLKKKR